VEIKIKRKLYFIIFVIVFVGISFGFFTLLSNLKQENISNEKRLISITYNTIINGFSGHSNLLFHNKIDTFEIKNIVKDAYIKGKKDKARDELFQKLNYMYQHMKNFKLKQLHFHLKDSESFLRFHRPQKYGDNLRGIRETVDYVNLYKIPINGFEEGRIFNGYRFVYPLELNGVHIGSVETSVSMINIIAELKKHLGNNIEFIIKKDVVDKKVFKNEKSNYKEAYLHKGYYTENSITQKENPYIKKAVNDNIEFINKNIKSEKSFSFLTYSNQSFNKTTYLPIKNAISNEVTAYIIINRVDNQFLKYFIEYVLFWTILSILTLFVVVAIYKIDKHRTILSHKDWLLNKVQDIGHLGYWEYKKRTDSMIFSSRIYEILQIDETQELTYDKYISFIHKDDREFVKSNLFKAINGDKKYKIEYRLELDTKEIKYIEEKCDHIKNIYGETIESIGTIHDITDIKNYQIKIESAKQNFESLISHIPDVVYRFDIDENLTILYANNSIESITGYSLYELKFNRKISFANIIHKDDLKKVKNSIKEFLNSKQDSLQLEYRIITKDKRTIWVKNHIDIVGNNHYKYIEGILSDITAQKEAYDKLYKFINTQKNIVILTDGIDISFANRRFFEFFEYETLEEFKDVHRCICEKFIEDEHFFHMNKIDGNKIWIEELNSMPEQKQIVAIYDKDMNVHAFSIDINKFENSIYIVSFTDITQTIFKNIELENKVIHDKLTNAYNREFFEQNYKKIVDNFTKNGFLAGLAILDIDHFKLINDNYGHNIGDIVLKELVKSVEQFLDDESILVRWGGEEFLLLLKVSSKDEFENSLNRVRESIQNHIFKDVQKITCSFGGTIYDSKSAIDDIIKRADESLYHSKESGRNRVTIK
jgi:diguanylate cyclase (GGDEF)-like protein/PAS domain S-box-containing protein